MARDLVISVFAAMSQSQLNGAGVKGLTPSEVRPLSRLRKPYDSVSIGKDEAGHVCATKDGVYCDTGDVWGGCCFDAVAPKYRAAGDGSLIRGLLKLKGYDPAAYEGGRIALISFSAGSTMAHHLLDSEVDRNLIDTFISLDSMTFPKTGAGLQPWPGYFAFAQKCTGMDRMSGSRNPYLGPMMVVANTGIVSASAAASSTKEAIQHLFKQLNGGYYAALGRTSQAFVAEQGRAQQEIMARVRSSIGNLPLPMTINCGGVKNYDAASAVPTTFGYLGNLWQLGWPGTGGPDHCFCAYVAQKVIIESFLLPRWNSGDVAVAGLGGLGADERVEEDLLTFRTPTWLRRGGGLIKPGALGPSVLPGTAKIALGLGLGIGAGYLLSKFLELER
jgi:hypothetical protein